MEKSRNDAIHSKRLYSGKVDRTDKSPLLSLYRTVHEIFTSYGSSFNLENTKKSMGRGMVWLLYEEVLPLYLRVGWFRGIQPVLVDLGTQEEEPHLRINFARCKVNEPNAIRSEREPHIRSSSFRATRDLIKSCKRRGPLIELGGETILVISWRVFGGELTLATNVDFGLVEGRVGREDSTGRVGPVSSEEGLNAYKDTYEAREVKKPQLLQFEFFDNTEPDMDHMSKDEDFHTSGNELIKDVVEVAKGLIQGDKQDGPSNLGVIEVTERNANSEHCPPGSQNGARREGLGGRAISGGLHMILNDNANMRNRANEVLWKMDADKREQQEVFNKFMNLIDKYTTSLKERQQSKCFKRKHMSDHINLDPALGVGPSFAMLHRGCRRMCM
ncbi:hypothetical protein Scep_001387 [Stephania cephalantha]|uniref:Uncharacterized protein n=1 Tax=Stephania cephalantha TaxID=152367 RepID=A0AAP0Q7P0_9MAGN